MNLDFFPLIGDRGALERAMMERVCYEPEAGGSQGSQNELTGMP